jgi:hypothetical protein
MARLEDLKPNASVKGILPSGPVTILSVQWIGSDVVEVAYRDISGILGSELIFRDRQADLEISAPGLAWAFDADGEMFRLVSEAYRIRMAHLFDPWLAIHLSRVEPLPHQITAVYGEMLPRQPLRFLLTDDPGAGKTIMTGLLIKELILRGDLQRCLIVSPGNLTEQWQDELSQKFQLPFELLTATPHNGKEEDFQLFMGLLDPDRFEGKYRPGVHAVDASDLMRPSRLRLRYQAASPRTRSASSRKTAAPSSLRDMALRKHERVDSPG